ncbi:MAG: ABC transporter ATP-binding protein [Longimicrobiales bacterium]
MPRRLSAAPVVRLERLALERAGRTLIRDLTWELEPGPVHWIVGENGLGKSTLLRVIAGRARPSAGSVVRASPLAWWGTRVPAPRVSVASWDRLLAGLLGEAGTAGSPELRPRDLPPDRRLDQLSNGELRRVLLEPVLRVAAAVLLLDEPFEHLSPIAKRGLRDRLTARAADAVVLVATNQDAWRLGCEPTLRLDEDAAWSLEDA